MTGQPALDTVMLVDSDSIEQIVYRQIINRAGVARNIVSQGNIDEAMAYLLHGGLASVDLIFLDCSVPGMNGVDFLDAAITEFGERFERCPIILLGASSDASERDLTSRSTQPRHRFSKPLTLDKVLMSCDYLVSGGCGDDLAHGRNSMYRENERFLGD